jgi:hypothetical protein
MTIKEIEDQILHAKRKIEVMSNNGFLGSVIDNLAGNDIATEQSKIAELEIALEATQSENVVIYLNDTDNQSNALTIIDGSFVDTKSTTTKTINSLKNISVETVAIGTAITGGAAATTAGVIAAGTSTTAAISAAGASVGGIAGGVIGAVTGSGVGLATGGMGMAATVPFAATGTALGSALGGYAGEVAAIFGIGTAPAWAVPVAIAGGVVMTGGLAVAGYKLYKSSKDKDK